MFRLIIICGLVWFAYKKLKSLVLPGPQPSQKVSGQNRQAIDDVMLQDPFCKTYFPGRDAVHLRIDGKDLYFCSTRCRDSFLAARIKS